MLKRFKKCKPILLFSLNLFLLGKYSNFPDVEVDDKMCIYVYGEAISAIFNEF